MGFRDEFFFIRTTHAEWSLERTVASGFRAEREELVRLQKIQQSAYESAAARQAEAAAELRSELEYQSDRIVDAIERGSADIVASIQQTCDHLGGELAEVRWSIERHTQVSQQALQVLLNSLGNTSRQYFEQGVKCYETGENAFARERFTKALEANRTNYFAYQYIGFIAVSEENAEEAIRNFELAQKFAEQAYHRALALSNLARAKRAIGDVETAVALSKQATALSPATPKFWYELAHHCVQLGRDDEMVNALRDAIERDWEYFTVVTSDIAFDPVRPRVNTLLSDLRRREGAKALEAIERLRYALSVAKTVGAENEARGCIQALHELENKHAKNNVFLHQEIQRDAPAWGTKTLQVARTVVEQRIAANRSDASQCASDKEMRIQELHSEISRLRAEQSRLRDTFKPIKWDEDLGCVYVIFYFAVIPYWIIHSINRYVRGTMPAKRLEDQIRDKASRLDGEKRRIDEEFTPRESRIQSQLYELMQLKAMCAEA